MSWERYQASLSTPLTSVASAMCVILFSAGSRSAQQPVARSSSCGLWGCIHQCICRLGCQDRALPTPSTAACCPRVRSGNITCLLEVSRLKRSVCFCKEALNVFGPSRCCQLVVWKTGRLAAVLNIYVLSYILEEKNPAFCLPMQPSYHPSPPSLLLRRHHHAHMLILLTEAFAP